MEKLQFFTQYLGQRVLKTKDDECPEIGNNLLTLNIPFLSLIENNPENYYLELKSLSKISDEHVLELFKKQVELEKADKVKCNDICFNNGSIFLEIRFYFGKGWSESYKQLNIEQIDYLRSKGYAIPYMKYSIQDLIEKKWITLEN